MKRSFQDASLVCNQASSRHIHGHRMHNHHPRQAASPILTTATSSSITSTSLPAATEVDAVIKDIQEIQSGLTDLPSDILKLITAVEQQLKDVENILSSLLSGSAEATSAASTTAQSFPPNYLPVIAPTTSSPSASSALCLPPGGAGPLVPCPVSRLTRTRTSTSLISVTTNVTFTAGKNTGRPYYPHYGGGTAPLPLNSNAYPTGSNLTYAPAYTTVYPTEPPTASSSSTTATYSLQPSPLPYTFNPDSDNNVAVYYGTTPATQAGGLLALCENPNVDIVILSFVSDFFSQNGYPTLNFGPGCSAPNSVQSTNAPGLKDCTALSPEISGCQQLGKKVLISLGGYIANSSLASDAQAHQFAQTLWNLFGAGTGDSPDLRPFGMGIVVDGFDIDNENHNTASYATFASALRAHFASDPSKPYYLSAAPQCPMPDASIPAAAMAQADFVWVQFYNNPSCNLDSAGFPSSFGAWSANLSAASPAPGRPRVYIGAGAFAGAGSGYVEGSGLSVPISLAREMYTDNLGGVMLWDGSEAMANVDRYGVDYLEYAKAALQG